MTLRLTGALLIIAACGGFGFSMAVNYRKQERDLRLLLKAIDIFSCELEYKQSPLPNVCRCVSETVGGNVGRLFAQLSDILDEQVCPDAACCMQAALQADKSLSHVCRKHLFVLGQTLGWFDVAGQLSELAAARKNCIEELDSLIATRDVRIRNYQTLSLCAGAALAILLI